MTEAVPQEQDEKLDINRREFLNSAWLASLGFLTVSFAGVTFLFALPIFKEGEFGGVVTIGPTSDLPTVDEPPDNYAKTKFWLSNTAGGVMALYKVCTHLGCLYNWRDQENKFVCPCHGSQFEKSGDYIQGPAPRSLDRFVVQAVDAVTGEIISESADGEPLPVPQDANVIIKVDTGRRVVGERHG